jgi:hypothetical protein
MSCLASGVLQSTPARQHLNYEQNCRVISATSCCYSVGSAVITLPPANEPNVYWVKRNHELLPKPVDFWKLLNQHSRESCMPAGIPSSEVLPESPASAIMADSRPIMKPPKKRRCTDIDMAGEPVVDSSRLEISSANFTDASQQISSYAVAATDLSAWKGQRVLARSVGEFVYRPGIIDSISNSDQPVGVLLDGEAEPRFFPCGPLPDVVGDYAPTSSAVMKGMQVCVRYDISNCKFYVGKVLERNAQSHQFLVEMEGFTATLSKSFWVSRANLRLLQVKLCHDHVLNLLTLDSCIPF